MCTNGYFPCSLAFLLAYEGEELYLEGLRDAREITHPFSFTRTNFVRGYLFISFSFFFLFFGWCLIGVICVVIVACFLCEGSYIGRK